MNNPVQNILNPFIMMNNGLLFACIGLFCISCQATEQKPAYPYTLVDAQATQETKALFANLKKISATHVLYGHEDDLAYGVKWENEQGRSDVKEASGSYPAVYGWDLGDLAQIDKADNLDGVDFDNMKQWIKEGYQRGGVITLSWHMNHLGTEGDTWDTTRVAHRLLPDGDLHNEFNAMLDRFASFVSDLKADSDQQELIPVIFRPYHEHTGWWFWWGSESTTVEEYVSLWRYTVEYLRDVKQVHNLLYAYSPNSLSEFDSYDDYWEKYPGDAYVDILGFDDYFTLQGRYGHEDGVAALGEHLSWLASQARDRNKIAAITETGLEGMTDPTWFTQKLLKAIQYSEDSKQIAYVLTWRNAQEWTKEGHFYAPYQGHSSASDFRSFREDGFVLFEDELPDMYTLTGF
ncbi:MAG: glycosyl hydrolase [Bacteroidota bacterium]